MYQERIIAFIDILGFGQLVEDSQNDFALFHRIISALNSMLPENLQKEADSTLNVDRIPASEVEEAEHMIKRFNEYLKDLYKVNISYFSDCIVLSALADNTMSKQMLLDILGKFSIRLWSENSLLIRGGITIGSLYHQENGPAFGPAMNRAYYLESKVAKSPRVIIDKKCIESFRKDRSFKVFESFISNDGELFFCSLNTMLRHFINDSSYACNQSKQIDEFKGVFKNLEAEIKNKIKYFEGTDIQEKYNWFIDDHNSIKPHIT